MYKQLNVDRRMALTELPNDETGQGHSDDYQRAAKERRLEPLEIVALIQDDLHATEDHGVLRGNAIEGSYGQARQVLDDLEALAISYADVVRVLEEEGVQKFTDSWVEMLGTISKQMDASRTGQPVAAGR